MGCLGGPGLDAAREQASQYARAGRDSAPDGPLLSALLTESGDEPGAMQLYRDLAERLGCPLLVDDAGLVEQSAAERAELTNRADRR